MNLREVLAVLLRWWYLPVLALALAGFAWYSWERDGGCYTSSTVVLFALPARSILLPESGIDDSNVIAFAGLVAQEINNGRPAPHYASRHAPLYGVGVRDGVLVGLPNSGTQWSSSYSQAEIEIQIVARSAEAVESTQRDVISRVFQITHDQQQSSRPEHRFTASVMPLTTDVQHVTATRSSKIVALLALAAAALLAAASVAVRLDRWRNSRTAHQATTGPGPGTRDDS